jgi:isoquinoline 1-oxidoreductase beta subunit
MQRRTFLIAGALATGTLLVGCASSTRQQLRNNKQTLPADSIALNAWVEVATTGKVTVRIGQSEMGQGIQTALVMLVAEEMDCGYENTGFRFSGIDSVYGNVAGIVAGVPFRPDDDGMTARSMRWFMRSFARQVGVMMTGGSSSVKDLWTPLREAAAVTRATLVEAAAKQWQVAASDIRVSEGTLSTLSGLKMSMGEAVTLLGKNPQPASNYRLKTVEEFKLIGTSPTKVDSAIKVNGKAIFGTDVRVPNMLYAAVKMAPVLNANIEKIDAREALSLHGVKGMVQFDNAYGGTGGVAVIADNYWKAQQAVKKIQLKLAPHALDNFSSANNLADLKKINDSESGFNFWKIADANKVIAESKHTLTAEYTAPFLAHATMEPMNCTVEYHGDSATLWVPTQVPGLARKTAAKILGLAEENVIINVTYLGSGFGRRGEVDFIAQAASIAKQCKGQAVKVIWSREEDMQHDFYRPAAVARFSAALDDAGNITAWRSQSAAQPIVPAVMKRLFGLPAAGPDKTTAEGAYDQAYAFLAVQVSHVATEQTIPVGFWRSVGHSHQAFFIESFMDECAHAAKADPLQYRLNLLANRPRERRVLELAAEKAEWHKQLQPTTDGVKKARGIALHESFGSIVAQVVEVSVNSSNVIRVHKVVCAIDCGIAVHPDIIAQQMESGIIFGLSAALYGEIHIENGQVKEKNFNDYRIVRISESPVIETHIVQSNAHPEGVGEPGVPPIAPAVSNAIFALTGQRLRNLPLKLEKQSS